MLTYWPKRNYLSWSNEYAVITYDKPSWYKNSSIKLPGNGPSSCVWIIPGSEND